MILENVFNYIHNNAKCDIRRIAEALQIEEKAALAAVEELQTRNFIKLAVEPLIECETKKNSCYYEAVADSFSDNAEYCHCKAIYSVWPDRESNPYGYWNTCGLCDKHIEDEFYYYNHNDGEDNDEDVWE